MSDFRLKVFLSVAKNLSFTKASQELFVSQPAITKHIQELETCYQARLFDRQGNKISLTEAGKLLQEHSEKILEDYKRLEYEMHLLHNEYIGDLKLGASTTIAQYVLPPLLANFIAKFPQVNLSLLNGNSREIEADLSRFVEAHDRSYSRALEEIREGRKQSHWMWYIFPQIVGLGLSSTSRFYAIADLEEARAYMQHPMLGAHMIEICGVLLGLSANDAEDVMGYPDDLKLRSSMTLFSQAVPSVKIFQQVLDKYFDGKMDQKTLEILGVHI